MKVTKINCDQHFSQNKLHFTLVTNFNARSVECRKQKSHIKLLSIPPMCQSMTVWQAPTFRIKLGDNPVLVSLCPPKISCRLAQVRIRVSAVRV